MDLKLAGKRALVTGSTSGIGIGIAKCLASEGAAVVISGRDGDRAEAVAQEIKSAGGKTAIALGDLATDEGAERAAAAALKAFGGIDILVNNAGGVSAESSAMDWFEVSPSQWGATYQMNAVAALRMTRLLAPAMKERRWGRVIQISAAGAACPFPASAHYSAAKAAIVNLTVSLSKALANSGVTANTISPGLIYTSGMKSWFDAIGAEKGWGDDFDRIAAYVVKEFAHQTVERLGQVEDVGWAVAYLASPLADFITGTNLRVDGGFVPSIN